MFADVTFTTEGLTVILTLLGALWGAIGILFKKLIDAKDQHIKSAQDRGDSYREMAEEAIDDLEKAANRKLRAEGKAHFTKVADVVPEHSSPVSQKQQETADLATMRARLVAATLELGLAPREASLMANEETT